MILFCMIFVTWITVNKHTYIYIHYYIGMYFKDVILALSWGARKSRKLNACIKYQLYSMWDTHGTDESSKTLANLVITNQISCFILFILISKFRFDLHLICVII